MKTIKQRFEEKYIPEPNSGCWLWTAAVGPTGYERFGFDGKNRLAHRISYKFYVGAIPDDKYVLHKCDVRCCVNPAHLWLGSYWDNMLDMYNKKRPNYERTPIFNLFKSHCVRGHILDGTNLLERSDGHRRCRTCHNDFMRKYQRQKRKKHKEATV